MDPTRFDALTRILSAAATRRGLLRFLPGLPVVSALAALLAHPAAADKDRDDRRERRRKRKKGKGNGPTPDVCAGLADDTPCGPGGDDGRCCQNGVCDPPLDCLPFTFPLGNFCGTTKAECAQKCCSQRGDGANCENGAGGDCYCQNSVSGEPCGSDADCAIGAFCVCGTCCCTACNGGPCPSGCTLCPLP